MKNTLIDFKNKSNKKHNYKYNYDKSVYINNYTKLIITCPEHGDFVQKPITHYIQGCGCPKCGFVKMSEKKLSNISIFIKKSNNVHNFLYNYRNSIYKNSKTKIEIICEKHGSFFQVPYVHLGGHGCLKCANEESSKRQISNKKEFTIKAIMVHGNIYDYSLVDYKGAGKKIKIICKKHGIFDQIPSSHLQGHGCKFCRESKGEREVEKVLNNMKICYIKQKRFIGCRYKLPLPFDFYLPDYNTCIEFDGELHFGIKVHFDYDKEIIKLRDDIKTKYCKDNTINLFRISYKENIIDKMTDEIKKIIKPYKTKVYKI